MKIALFSMSENVEAIPLLFVAEWDRKVIAAAWPPYVSFDSSSFGRPGTDPYASENEPAA